MTHPSRATHASTAYLDGYSTRLDLPPAHSSSRGYGYFPPPPEDRETVLYVGATPDEMRPYFSEVGLLAPGGNDPRASGVWLCTGRNEPWVTFRPKLRHLDVAQ
ncbi:hypothetical protein [Pseudonocardia sp. H11422]|uniref:hypothetical protein n=1 Tax=Pseudonocardia sp. H11422 TaxID=2835866 RepID=UPI001BDC048D|nr:hypothetical protein [Pseudonocardia sp. H11422]